MDVLTMIEERMSGFSKGQKLIGKFMLEHYEKAAYMTASKLGAFVGVSESTVVRFANELGFEGYPELQKSLQELIRNKLTSLQRIEISNYRIGDEAVPTKVLLSDIDKIKYTLENIDPDMFSRTVDAIIRAGRSGRIYIMGVRSSSSLAHFLNFYFNMLFDNVRLVQTTSRSEIYEQMFRAGENDLFIGISFPRYSKRAVSALEYAKKLGAATLAITDAKTSPLAEHADYLLTAKSDMASFVDSLVAPLSLINAVIVAVARKEEANVSETFGKLESFWEQSDVYEKHERHE